MTPLGSWLWIVAIWLGVVSLVLVWFHVAGYHDYDEEDYDPYYFDQAPLYDWQREEAMALHPAGKGHVRLLNGEGNMNMSDDFRRRLIDGRRIYDFGSADLGNLDDLDERLTICNRCGVVYPLTGQHSWFAHVLSEHPTSAEARAIGMALDKRVIELQGKFGGTGGASPAAEPHSA